MPWKVSNMSELRAAFVRQVVSLKIPVAQACATFGIERSLSYYPLCGEAQRLGRFVPLRGDGCGDYDCLIIGDGPCERAMVFWDHEVYDGAAYLLGGSLLNYLDMWADYMVHNFLPSGERAPEDQHPWPFDEAWMRERDPIADRLLGDESSRRWLLRQDDLT